MWLLLCVSLLMISLTLALVFGLATRRQLHLPEPNRNGTAIMPDVAITNLSTTSAAYQQSSTAALVYQMSSTAAAAADTDGGEQSLQRIVLSQHLVSYQFEPSEDQQVDILLEWQRLDPDDSTSGWFVRTPTSYVRDIRYYASIGESSDPVLEGVDIPFLSGDTELFELSREPRNHASIVKFPKLDVDAQTVSFQAYQILYEPRVQPRMITIGARGRGTNPDA